MASQSRERPYRRLTLQTWLSAAAVAAIAATLLLFAGSGFESLAAHSDK